MPSTIYHYHITRSITGSAISCTEVMFTSINVYSLPILLDTISYFFIVSLADILTSFYFAHAGRERGCGKSCTLMSAPAWGTMHSSVASLVQYFNCIASS